jgi:hypothetical protein
MGYEVEVHPEGAQLNSYYSGQEAKVANIVIRRQQLRGAYGDIGFARQRDGQLAMIKDELDERRGYGAKWKLRDSPSLACLGRSCAVVCKLIKLMFQI